MIRWLKAIIVFSFGLALPLYLLVSSGWLEQPQWDVCSIVILGIYIMALISATLAAFGISGKQFSTEEQDRKLLQKWDRFHQKYIAPVLYIVAIVFCVLFGISYFWPYLFH